MTRDPKLDPFPGDILRKGNQTRKVARITITESMIEVAFKPQTSTASVKKDRYLGIATWRNWARDAEVVTIGGAK